MEMLAHTCILATKRQYKTKHLFQIFFSFSSQSHLKWSLISGTFTDNLHHGIHWLGTCTVYEIYSYSHIRLESFLFRLINVYNKKIGNKNFVAASGL